MLRKMMKFLYIPREISFLKNEIETVKLLNGRLLTELNRNRIDDFIDNIHLSEFKVFSQFGDDGIIQFLINYLKIKNDRFVEFGVENYLESNTRFLLINNNWSGLVFDALQDNVNFIKKDKIYWKYDLKAETSFVTSDNINSLLKKNGFEGEIGLLHIDIDGNDYWIWKAIEVIEPVIVIIEYNSVFGDDKSWTIPYDSKFYRTKHHFSRLYYGCSILSLCDLAEEKGYAFIGCNSNGNNAYFINKSRLAGLKKLNAKEGYVLSKFRESRDMNGNLTYQTGANRIAQIKGMEIFNTRSNLIEII